MPPATIWNWFCASSAIDVGGGVDVVPFELDAGFLEVAVLERHQLGDVGGRARDADLDGRPPARPPPAPTAPSVRARQPAPPMHDALMIVSPCAPLTRDRAIWHLDEVAPFAVAVERQLVAQARPARARPRGRRGCPPPPSAPRRTSARRRAPPRPRESACRRNRGGAGTRDFEPVAPCRTARSGR